MGNRYSSIIHARLRNNCSSLNNDFFRNHVRDNPLCEWCCVIEDATHFFFQYIKYTDERQVFNDTVTDFQPLTINLILFGINGPRCAVGYVSGNKCESDCRSRGRMFDLSPVPYFRVD